MKFVKYFALLAVAGGLAGCTEIVDKTRDRGTDAKDLSQLKAGIWVDPQGCDHWIIDDGQHLPEWPQDRSSPGPTFPTSCEFDEPEIPRRPPILGGRFCLKNAKSCTLCLRRAVWFCTLTL